MMKRRMKILIAYDESRHAEATIGDLRRVKAPDQIPPARHDDWSSEADAPSDCS